MKENNKIINIMSKITDIEREIKKKVISYYKNEHDKFDNIINYTFFLKMYSQRYESFKFFIQKRNFHNKNERESKITEPKGFLDFMKSLFLLISNSYLEEKEKNYFTNIQELNSDNKNIINTKLDEKYEYISKSIIIILLNNMKCLKVIDIENKDKKDKKDKKEFHKIVIDTYNEVKKIYDYLFVSEKNNSSNLYEINQEYKERIIFYLVLGIFKKYLTIQSENEKFDEYNFIIELYFEFFDFRDILYSIENIEKFKKYINDGNIDDIVLLRNIIFHNRVNDNELQLVKEHITKTLSLHERLTSTSIEDV